MIDNKWDGHERRSSNPWIDRIMDELHEAKEMIRLNSIRLEKMENRLDQIERFIPEVKPIATLWSGSAIVAKIMLVVSTGIGAVWALFEWVSKHLK